MGYTDKIYEFKNRFFSGDDASFIVFSDEKKKLKSHEAENEAKLLFTIDRFNCCTKDFEKRFSIFANSIDEVEFILSAFSKDIFVEWCMANRFDFNMSLNGYALWKLDMNHYRVKWFKRRNCNFIHEKTCNLLEFLEERAEACAGAHAQSKV